MSDVLGYLMQRREDELKRLRTEYDDLAVQLKELRPMDMPKGNGMGMETYDSELDDCDDPRIWGHEDARQQEGEGVVVQVEDYGVEGYGFFVGKGKHSRIYNPKAGTYRLTRIQGEGSG